MTFTLFTNSLFTSIYHNIKHVYNMYNITIYERINFMLLSILSVISYNLGMNNATSFRNIEYGKDYIIHDKIGKNNNKNIVVIPTYIRNNSDKDKLKNSIKSVLEFSESIIIVVDDGSPLSIMDIANSNVILVKHFDNYGPGAARNTGIEVALSNFDPPFISFIDTDCQVDFEWMDLHYKNQFDEPGIYCGQTVALNNDIISRYHDKMGTLNGRSIGETLLYGPSCNMSISKDILQKFKFDERFPNASFEDVELCVRLIKNNIKPKYLENAILFHDYDNTILGFYNQFYKYGRSHPLMLKIHPEYNQWYSGSKEISVL